MSILRLYQYLETKRQSKHATGRCSKHDSGERCHEEAHMHQDPSGMLARIPFGLTTGPIEGAEILVAGCRKETVASEMRSNVLKYRDTLMSYQQHQPMNQYQQMHKQRHGSGDGNRAFSVFLLLCRLVYLLLTMLNIVIYIK
jgi:hypothetical protein